MSSWGGYQGGEEEEEEEEDALLAKDLQSVQDNIMLLIDARPSMLVKDEQGKIPLVIAFEIAHHLLRKKIMMSQRDCVGITLFGAETSTGGGRGENGDGGEGGAAGSSAMADFFANQPVPGSQAIELQPLAEPSASRIKDVERLCHHDESIAKVLQLKWGGGNNNNNTASSSSSSPALREGIRVCIRTLMQRSKKERDSRRIWLFTNEDDPSGPNDPSQLIKDAQDNEVDMRLWYFPPPGGDFDENKFYGPLLSLPSKDEKGDALGDTDIADEDETVSDMKLLNAGMKDTRKLLEETQSRIFKKRRYARMAFHLSSSPPISLNVALYKMIQPCRKPNPIQLAAASQRRLAATTKWMCESLVQYVDLDLDVEYGLELGAKGSTVPFERQEFEDLKRTGHAEPGMHLLAFLPVSELAWELNVTSSTMIYPEEYALKGCTKAFIGLREAMLKRQRMALVRYHATNRAEPRLAALLANEDSEGLELIKLPFLEDLRAVEGGGDALSLQADKAQIEVAKKLVKKLEGNRRPSEFSNPSLQKFYSALQALALEETELEWDEDTDDHTQVDEERMLKTVGGDLGELWEKCPEEEVASSSKGKGGKRKAAAAESPAAKKPKKKEKEEEESGGGGGETQDLESLIETGDINKMTVPDLKALCRSHDLPVNGKKAELIERLKLQGNTDDADF